MNFPVPPASAATSSIMPFDAIGFDLWETLITDTPEQARRQEQLRLERIEAILRENGFARSALEVEQAYRRIWHQCLDLYWSRDIDIPCRRQVDHLLEALHIDAGSLPPAAVDAVESAYADAAVEIPPAIVEGAEDALAAMRAEGLRIGIISNTGRTPGSALRRILENAGLAPMLDAMVFSNEHGVCKPQRSIFEELREGLRSDFDRMMFVGDNPYVDVHGAQNCGMRGILFVPEVRGTAVAPPVDHGLEIVPDAVIGSMRELSAAVERIRREASR